MQAVPTQIDVSQGYAQVEFPILKWGIFSINGAQAETGPPLEGWGLSGAKPPGRKRDTSGWKPGRIEGVRPRKLRTRLNCERSSAL
jgi:hypothetical protein